MLFRLWRKTWRIREVFLDLFTANEDDFGKPKVSFVASDSLKIDHFSLLIVTFFVTYYRVVPCLSRALKLLLTSRKYNTLLVLNSFSTLYLLHDHWLIAAKSNRCKKYSLQRLAVTLYKTYSLFVTHEASFYCRIHFSSFEPE